VNNFFSAATGTSLNVGTLSARTLSLSCFGAATTSAEPMPHTSPTGADYPSGDRSAAAWSPGATSGDPAVITLSNPVNYLGVYWIWGNSGDQFVLRSGGVDVITFGTSDLMDAISGTTVSAIGGATYEREHFLGGRKGFGTSPDMNTEPAVYIHFVAPPGTSFDEVRLSAHQLEFDNLAIANYSGTFDTNGLVGVALSAGSVPAEGLVPTNKQVTFSANGGSGTVATQSALTATSAPLQTNPFTRAGYTFSGWNTEADGSGVAYANGATFPFTADIVLYAQWTLVAPPAAPPTTATPPTTAPVTTVPTPIPDLTGELPRMLPGQASVIQNGEVTPVEIFFDDLKALNVRGQDFQLRLTGDCSSGCSVVSETTGREVLLLRRDGNALFDGFGFMPGTLVHFWIFSEPVYLGSLLVGEDGTFDGSLFLTGIDPGEHTLQLNGISFDGQDRSANLGVLVTTDAEPLPALPATGSNSSNELMLLGLSLAMLGFIITVRRRA
jgi:LPXTG-motif cell wall-anchored protein/uncharacterized repeat protein (TIGR02543 family)